MKTPVYDSSTLGFPALYKLRELIRYRTLIWNLVGRDLKVRYKRSIIGFAWVMLNPLLTMGVLVIVFSTLYQSQIPQFSTYVLSGLLVWNMFSQGTIAALSSMQANSATIRKIYVPPSAFTLSAVGSALVNFAFALLPFVILALLDGLRPHLSWLYLVVPSLEAAMLTAGVGLIVSALVVFFADIFEIYQVLLNILFFLTPVMYPVSILSSNIRAVVQLSPIYLIIDDFRTVVMFNHLPSLLHSVVSLLLSSAVLLVGWLIFTGVEDRFAYHL